MWACSKLVHQYRVFLYTDLMFLVEKHMKLCVAQRDAASPVCPFLLTPDIGSLFRKAF